jgi:hypothetical protein
MRKPLHERPIRRRIGSPASPVLRPVSGRLTMHPILIWTAPYRESLRFILLVLWLSLVPRLAQAGMWNGGLCTVYQQVLDNELLEVVSLSALVGSIVLWLLDDGRSNIKTHVLRGVMGTLAILNMPLLWAQVFNHGAACAASL